MIVEAASIEAVGPGLANPAGAKVVDLGDATLFPGFIDAHTHMTGESDDNWYKDTVDDLRQGVPEHALRASGYARKTLSEGFTTVRDVGSGEFVDVGLRNAVNARRPRPTHAGGGPRPARPSAPTVATPKSFRCCSNTA